MGARARILLYLAIVIAGCVVCDTMIVRAGGMTAEAAGSWVVGVMWTPAVAAAVTQLLTKRTLAGIGWWPRRWTPLAVGWFAPIVYGGLPFALAALVGAGAFNIDFWTQYAARNGLPASPAAGLAFLAVAGTGISLLTATGEEIGWRGFLVPALGERLGFWGVTWVSAVIWALYHLPLILFAGYRETGTPLAYNLVCFAGLVAMMSPMLTALRLRSGSFWATALMHASHNLFIQLVFAGAFRPDATTPWLVGEFAAPTFVIGAVVVALYLWRAGIPKTAAEGG